jgi:tetratricopeptide (TPR) repeat protein
MATSRIDPTKSLRRGIRACRAGNWWEGHGELTRLAQQEERRGNLPGLFYSYLGQAMARCEGRRREGLDLCLHAVKVDPFQPENYVNLAGAYVMLRNRRGALRALERGLRIDPTHAGLLEVGRKLGERRRPPLPFLARGHLLNRYFGLMSSRLRRRWSKLRQADEVSDDFWSSPVRDASR